MHPEDPEAMELSNTAKSDNFMDVFLDLRKKSLAPELKGVSETTPAVLASIWASAKVIAFTVEAELGKVFCYSISEVASQSVDNATSTKLTIREILDQVFLRLNTDCKDKIRKKVDAAIDASFANDTDEYKQCVLAFKDIEARYKAANGTLDNKAANLLSHAIAAAVFDAEVAELLRTTT